MAFTTRRYSVRINPSFGTVFPWWDRLHRILRVNIPQDEVVVGIPGYSLPEDNAIWNTLLIQA
jgi:hypothetical protein